MHKSEAGGTKIRRFFLNIICIAPLEVKKKKLTTCETNEGDKLISESARSVKYERENCWREGEAEK